MYLLNQTSKEIFINISCLNDIQSYFDITGNFYLKQKLLQFLTEVVREFSIIWKHFWLDTTLRNVEKHMNHIKHIIHPKRQLLSFWCRSVIISFSTAMHKTYLNKSNINILYTCIILLYVNLCNSIRQKLLYFMTNDTWECR